MVSDSFRYTVYTAITGDYDKLLAPNRLMPNVDYICFTNSSSGLEVCEPWKRKFYMSRD